MKAWEAIRLRLNPLSSSRSALLSLGLPLLLLLLLAGVVRNGRPFERHRIAVDTRALSADEQRQLNEQFRHTDEIRLVPAASRAGAESLLRLGMVSAVLSREPGRPAVRLLVGPNDVLFGWGLASAIAQPVELALAQVPRFRYLHFLFPGVLTFSIVTSSLFGMGRVIRNWRQSLLSSDLVAPQRASRAFVVSQALRQSLVVLVQVGLLVLCARLLFNLPLSLHGAAWLAAISVVGLLAFTGVGFAVACCIQTESTLVKVSVLIQLPLVLLSEAILLLDELPRPLRIAGELLPTTYLVRLFREVLLEGGTGTLGFAPGFAVLTALGLVSSVVSLKLLEWRK